MITANNAFLHSSLPHFDRALLLFPAAAADNAIRAAVERGGELERGWLNRVRDAIKRERAAVAHVFVEGRLSSLPDPK